MIYNTFVGGEYDYPERKKVGNCNYPNPFSLRNLNYPNCYLIGNCDYPGQDRLMKSDIYITNELYQTIIHLSKEK